MLRFGAFLAGLLAVSPALAQQMTAQEARRFVVGKTFVFSCFEGTRGAGRIHADGSVAGTIQFRGSGPVRWAQLPAGTVLVRGESVCANVRGMPFQPCFSLQKTSARSFRGSVSGLGFASCEFTRRGPVEVATADNAPLSLRSTLSSR
ncbi:MAG: hypothetical protein KJZ73_07275 [Pseudorhodoplanes sp.]|nr:hypothetical protein [Pseudorhodoplanes sp.]MBW7948589.1 hypothetical protein [Pseudorhodoplanes sp.]MCL4711035.1 hypothetical protein [Pseudorhodoplanes sp.]